jgi:hypothetical protein
VQEKSNASTVLVRGGRVKTRLDDEPLVRSLGPLMRPDRYLGRDGEGLNNSLYVEEFDKRFS